MSLCVWECLIVPILMNCSFLKYFFLNFLSEIWEVIDSRDLVYGDAYKVFLKNWSLIIGLFGIRPTPLHCERMKFLEREKESGEREKKGEKGRERNHGTVSHRTPRSYLRVVLILWSKT